MEKKIRILLVDDHQVVLDGLQTMLDYQPDFCVVGKSKTAREALSNIDELKPDIVLMDIKMPGVDGIELARQVLDLHPDCKIIMLTLYDEYLADALAAGTRGYLLKDIKAQELSDAIKRVYAGQIVISESIRKLDRMNVISDDILVDCDISGDQVDELQLVLSPPVEANQLLKLAGHTEETLRSRVLQMVGAWQEGTIMTVILNSKTGFTKVLEDLRGIPEISSIAESPANEPVSAKLLQRAESMPASINRSRKTVYISLQAS